MRGGSARGGKAGRSSGASYSCGAMRPRADEVLKSALWTFDEYIAPEVTEPFAKSLTFTVGNLMRNVLARIEHEGQALFDDNRETRAVLDEIRTWIENTPAAAERSDLVVVAQGITEEQGQRYWTPDEYPSLAKVTEESLALRALLVAAIAALQAAKQDLGADAGYLATRRSIRRCIKHQLEREAVWSTEALEGPRR